MIARLRGKPVALDAGRARARRRRRRLPRRGDAERGAQGRRRRRVDVETYLHVREDALQLYGFAERAERELFVQLLSVNGVGPKVALAIVSGSPADELRRAIVREDTARFQAIPGIGKKTAERIVLELKEKLGVRRRSRRRPARRRRPRRRARRARRARLLARRRRARARETDADAPPEERVRQALRRAA